MAGVSMADSGGARGKKSLDMQLPLVPFIDLLCSLISFLLMTAVFNQIARLELSSGNAAPPPPNQSPTPTPKQNVLDDLRVEVHEKGFTIVENNKDEQPVACLATGAGVCLKAVKVKAVDGSETVQITSFYDYDTLLTKLNAEKAKYTDQSKITVVLADKVPYDDMIRTMDTCLKANIQGVSVSGTPL
jgi:biopolymer transport protein ExbD